MWRVVCVTNINRWSLICHYLWMTRLTTPKVKCLARLKTFRWFINMTLSLLKIDMFLHRTTSWSASHFNVSLESTKYILFNSTLLDSLWLYLVFIKQISFHFIKTTNQFPFEFRILFELFHSFNYSSLIWFIFLNYIFKCICVIYYGDIVLETPFKKLVANELPTCLPKVIKHSKRFLWNNISYIWWHLFLCVYP